MNSALDAVLQTELLQQRPSREPDYARERVALLNLVKSISDAPRAVLQVASDLAMQLCGGQSAGVTVLAANPKLDAFTRPAIAGAWASYVGTSAPRSFSPYGITVERNASQLFRHPQNYYTYIADIDPPVEEVLLAPFTVDTMPVGAVWVALHDTSGQFEAEDERLLNSLARCASAVHQVCLTIVRLSEGIDQDVSVDLSAQLRQVDDQFDSVPVDATPPQSRLTAKRKLSPREYDVVRMVAAGHTNKAIAEALGVTVKSVETYRARACDKAGLRSRADFVRFALGHGLLATG